MFHAPGGGNNNGDTNAEVEHAVEEENLAEQGIPAVGEGPWVTEIVDAAGDNCQKREDDGDEPQVGAAEFE